MRTISETLSLKDLACGVIGKVTLNMHADEVESILGQAMVKGGASKKYKWPCIWKYGDVELHFDQVKKTLWLIYIETYYSEEIISGEKVFDFENSGLKFGMKKEDFINIILREGLTYSEEEDYNPGMIRVRTLKLSAIFAINDEKKGLISISVMNS